MSERPTIAVIGASPDRSKFGNMAVRAYVAAGYAVFPVHPSAPEVEGLTAYPTVADLPVDRLDRASLYLPPPVALAVLPALAKISVGEVYLNPGADAPEVVELAERLGLNAIRACSLIAARYRPD